MISRTIKTGDGCRIAYRFDGPEDAPMLLLSNSLGTDMAIWDPQDRRRRRRGAAAPRQLLDEAAAAQDAAVKLRVQAAKDAFMERKKAEREKLHAQAEILRADEQIALFPNSDEEIWAVTCPACGCNAFMTGEQTGEDITKEPEEYGIWEIVDREFVGEDFKCPTCDLSLNGSEELDAAGINTIYEDRREREIEYEPDYGND